VEYEGTKAFYDLVNACYRALEHFASTIRSLSEDEELKTKIACIETDLNKNAYAAETLLNKMKSAFDKEPLQVHEKLGDRLGRDEKIVLIMALEVYKKNLGATKDAIESKLKGLDLKLRFDNVDQELDEIKRGLAVCKE